MRLLNFALAFAFCIAIGGANTARAECGDSIETEAADLAANAMGAQIFDNCGGCAASEAAREACIKKQLKKGTKAFKGASKYMGVSPKELGCVAGFYLEDFALDCEGDPGSGDDDDDDDDDDEEEF